MKNKYIFNQFGVGQIIVLFLVLIGIVVAVALVQKEQIFKSQAAINPIRSAFEIKDADGNKLDCIDDQGIAKCSISTQEISFELKDLNAFIQAR